MSCKKSKGVHSIDGGTAQAEAQTRRAPAAPPVSCTRRSGAPPSNTAPTNYNLNDFQFLRAGVDSLYLSYSGSIHDYVEHSLSNLKEFAQFAPPGGDEEPAFLLSDHRLEVSPRGRGRFPFLISDNWYDIQLSSSQAKALPFAVVRLSSELLSNCGFEEPVRKLRFLLDGLGEPGDQKISRLDICADFHTEFDFSSVSRDAWLSKSNRLSSYYQGEGFTGYSFGQGGGISARLYDKTTEILKSKKTFLYELWSKTGWQGELPVWRLEFQLRRNVLTEFGIHRTEDLFESLNGLWRYATETWLRMVVPSDSDVLKSRWPTHPIWSQLQRATFNSGPSCPPVRTRKERLPSSDFLYVNGLGGLTSFMAAHSITSVEEGMRAYLSAAQAFHNTRAASDFSFGTYIQRKLKEKAGRFNTKLRPQPQELDPQAYRKAKGGE